MLVHIEMTSIGLLIMNQNEQPAYIEWGAEPVAAQSRIAIVKPRHVANIPMADARRNRRSGDRKIKLARSAAVYCQDCPGDE